MFVYFPISRNITVLSAWGGSYRPVIVMNPHWYFNHPFGPFVDVIGNIDDGYDSGSEASSVSSLPDMEEITVPTLNLEDEAGEGLMHAVDDGEDDISAVITVYTGMLIIASIALAMIAQKPSGL